MSVSLYRNRESGFGVVESLVEIDHSGGREVAKNLKLSLKLGKPRNI